ncbi:hypothetical protein ANCCAN_20268, partial [Ancylostoma caninum]
SAVLKVDEVPTYHLIFQDAKLPVLNKGANEWQTNTCINFKENREGNEHMISILRAIVVTTLFIGFYSGETVIVSNDVNYQDTLGGPFLAFYDILMLNTHYSCLDKCKKDSKAAIYEMIGFPHPHDCTKCICPSGLRWTLCGQRISKLTMTTVSFHHFISSNIILYVQKVLTSYVPTRGVNIATSMQKCEQ